ncbi:hypothetical protein TSOC_000760 [Tetrabaena socialis]|uniref:Uncharacterized protein n=1 Tax=Tetrabaena socialis TaxID=47790 RepID=A0A2J8AIC0_9CHLO|nr:hypothetical protein TSOC_000760 [Tetrabaena socialis]|eukprot:PNH12269.1 hypothetical protein TSOC_000760 [Tetrabaena socialis]
MSESLVPDPVPDDSSPPQGLLRVTTVQVVQAVDLGELEKTIKSLFSKIAALPVDGGRAEIDALREQNGSLKDLVDELRSKQDAIEARLDTKQDRDQAGAPAAGDSSPSGAAASDLEQRLATLEQRQEAADAAAAADGAASPSSGEQLAELLAGQHALAATVAGLQHELEAKPSRAEVDQKANRSELDALMRAGAVGAAPGGGGGDGEAPALEVGADGSVDNGAVVNSLNKTAADLAALRGQLLVLQDRVEGKRLIAVLSREVNTLREGLDTVSHAANVMAVGLDAGARASTTGAAGTGGVEGRYSETGAPAGHPGGKELRSSRGGYERLIKLVGSGDYRHKMDAFDPAALQQMAQKLAYLEATMKSPAMGRIGAGGAPATDYGMKEMERQLKRLATDVRLIKDKSTDTSAAGTGRNPLGDHAMLASRPIVGYRCMACDRPLDQLDMLPGPHIPTQQLPARVAPPAMEVPTRGIKSGRAEPLSPQSSAQRQQQMTNDPNVRGVQNWYKDEKGLAAEALPRDHVGPHLPPGGWRPSNPGTVPSKQTALSGSPLPLLNGIRKGTPSTAEYDQRSTPPPGVPMEGTAANVLLPQIS